MLSCTWRRLLFIRTDRLGETLLNLPAIDALRAARPDGRITLLVRPEQGELLADLAGVEEVLLVSQAGRAGWWLRAVRLAWRLRRLRFDVAIVSNASKELHLAVALAGIPVRVGYARKWSGLLTQRIADRKAAGERHEVNYNLDLVRALGISVEPPAVVRSVDRLVQQQTAAMLAQRGIAQGQVFVVVHPWTSNPRKQWPLGRWRELMDRMGDRWAIPIVVVGGTEEQQAARSLCACRGNILNLVGETTLRQTAAVLQQARVLVSNDSGPVHLASAVGTCTVALFGTAVAGAGPRRWGPWGQGHTVIWKPSMEIIAVEEVFDAVRAHIERFA